MPIAGRIAIPLLIYCYHKRQSFPFGVFVFTQNSNLYIQRPQPTSCQLMLFMFFHI